MGKMLRPKKGPQKKEDSGQKNVYGQVNFIASFGCGHRGQTYEEVVQRLRELVAQEWPDAPERRGAAFTPTGGHYLVDGKVCRVQDFDSVTMDRRPGTYPPSYSLSGDEKKASILAERAEEALKAKQGQEPVDPPKARKKLRRAV